MIASELSKILDPSRE